ncbi:MAG: hypothetical protein M1837_003948 [Sclerophora amabilis]|nr:MAG: hypothetical protein M1837_003948 [Sclerophora amabilis]
MNTGTACSRSLKLFLRGQTGRSSHCYKPCYRSLSTTTTVPSLSKAVQSPPRLRRSKSTSGSSSKRLAYDFNNPGNDVGPVKFDYVYLRDSCNCPLCVDPSTRQKLFSTAEISLDITSREVVRSDDGVTRIRWRNDIPGYDENHESVYSLEFFLNGANARYDTAAQVYWDRALMQREVNWLAYDDYIRDEKVLLQALLQLKKYGLVFLKDVPQGDERAVERIGERIGVLRDTFYGRTWDVRSMVDAKNVAYTSQRLGLHMDLLYFADPPGLQLLHCLRNTTEGGSSLFADSFRAASELLAAKPNCGTALKEFPVTWHYRNDSQHYHYTRPTVELERYMAKSSRQASISNVNWSPPFQAPFEVNNGTHDNGQHLRLYLHSARLLAEKMEADEALFEMRLEEGQCVIFNNRRVVHGRRAFDAGSGERWLKGAYLDGDAFRSRFRVLSEKHGPEYVVHQEVPSER